MLELSQRRAAPGAQTRYFAQNQPRKLVIALVLLLTALVVVLVKDRQFWFGTEQATIESDLPAAAPQPTAQPAAAPAPMVSAHTTRKQVSAAKVVAEPAPAEPPVVRTVLPPLDVEVVAGDKHSAVHPGSNVKKVEITDLNAAAPAQPAPSFEPATNAAQRESVAAPVVTAAAIQAPQAAFHATYPVLASHMNVQGSVVLQAVISAEGTIEDLKILSGPAILATAAQQAVREWRFRPIYQNGKAVESKAKITVSFTIKVADTAPRNTLAESRTSDNPIVNR
jgi:periplasmic protein TonB